MQFHFIDTIEQAREVFPLMRQLREHLDEPKYLELITAAKAESNYRMIGLYDHDKCVGLMGYRVITDLVHGRHLYIDDLVTEESRRSQGIGEKLLAKSKELAAELGCERLRLCTGITNTRGMKFYERMGWELRAHAYKTKI